MKILFMHCSPHFPDLRFAGQSFALKPSDDGSPVSYTVGRGASCDISFTPQPNTPKDARNHLFWISKCHFTIHGANGRWFILDGCYGKRPGDSEPTYHESTNGTFLNGQRLKQENPEPVRENDHINLSLSPFTRIVVGQSLEDTLFPETWEDGGDWPEESVIEAPEAALVVSEATVAGDPPDLKEFEIDNLIEDEGMESVDISPPEVSHWGLAGQFLKWIASPTESGFDFILKIVMIIAMTVLIVVFV